MPTTLNSHCALTLRAPEISEPILDGRQPPELTLGVLMKPFAVGWVNRRAEEGQAHREKLMGDRRSPRWRLAHRPAPHLRSFDRVEAVGQGLHMIARPLGHTQVSNRVQLRPPFRVQF